MGKSLLILLTSVLATSGSSVNLISYPRWHPPLLGSCPSVAPAPRILITGTDAIFGAFPPVKELCGDELFGDRVIDDWSDDWSDDFDGLLRGVDATELSSLSSFAASECSLSILAVAVSSFAASVSSFVASELSVFSTSETSVSSFVAVLSFVFESSVSFLAASAAAAANLASFSCRNNYCNQRVWRQK